MANPTYLTAEEEQHLLSLLTSPLQPLTTIATDVPIPTPLTVTPYGGIPTSNRHVRWIRGYQLTRLYAPGTPMESRVTPQGEALAIRLQVTSGGTIVATTGRGEYSRGDVVPVYLSGSTLQGDYQTGVSLESLPDILE